jgi:hypothetical protein
LLGGFDCNNFWCLCEILVDRASSLIHSLAQDQRKNNKNSRYKRVWSPDSESTKTPERLTLKCLSCESKDLWGGRLYKETRRSSKGLFLAGPGGVGLLYCANSWVNWTTPVPVLKYNLELSWFQFRFHT